ncbi:MAG: 2-hydroxychromene-2-carboxylate isomerase [Hyphomonas sp.]|uniref:2-hydroxychromene-2-carboxylate isomerase n=1 Tax=Hyphomonas sp. TaxID=87 RepID=UPI00349FEEDB
MSKSFEFYFDFTSPTAYLALPVVLSVEERTGAEAIFVPMFLGGVMQGSGNKPPGTVPAKAKYMNRDLQRCAAHIGVKVYMNPAFPINTLAILRGLTGMTDKAEQRRFIKAAFHAAWGQPDPVDLGDPAKLAALCTANGFDADAFLAAAQDPANKQKLKEVTDGAIARGVFGAPSFFVGDELYFGHDRLDYVERALA